MSNIVFLEEHRREKEIEVVPDVPNELCWQLASWNKLIGPINEDAFCAVPYDGWPEHHFGDLTPFQRETLQRITELVRPWIDSQIEATAIFFYGADGVIVSIGDCDIELDAL